MIRRPVGGRGSLPSVSTIAKIVQTVRLTSCACPLSTLATIASRRSIANSRLAASARAAPADQPSAFAPSADCCSVSPRCLDAARRCRALECGRGRLRRSRASPMARPRSSPRTCSRRRRSAAIRSVAISMRSPRTPKRTIRQCDGSTSRRSSWSSSRRARARRHWRIIRLGSSCRHVCTTISASHRPSRSSSSVGVAVHARLTPLSITAMLQFRDGPFSRPHPAVWRMCGRTLASQLTSTVSSRPTCST